MHELQHIYNLMTNVVNWSLIMNFNPISMRADMAQAVDAGLKTQTRRIGEKYANWQVGHLLWVREPWAVMPRYDHLKPSELMPGGVRVFYAGIESIHNLKQRQARFMPRWASRLTLRITDICREPLHSITQDDAMAEGISPCPEPAENTPFGHFQEPLMNTVTNKPINTAVDVFADLWDEINGPGAWEENPWVWRIEFEKVGE